MHQNIWSWNASYMNSHNIFQFHIYILFVIWRSWHNWKIWWYHMLPIRAHMNRHYLYDARGIYFITHIIDSLIISLSDSIHKLLFLIIIHIVLNSLPQMIFHFLIVIDNINHLSIIEFILVIIRKYQFLYLYIIVRIKFIHHHLILNDFLWYLSNISPGYFLFIDHSSSSISIHYHFRNQDTLLYQPKYCMSLDVFLLLSHPLIFILTP